MCEVLTEPFIGPSFGYGMGGVAAWTWTESHATLHLAPGVAAIVGTLFLLRGRRAGQTFGSLLAMTGGIWFVIAPSLHPLWAGQGMAGMSGMSGMVSLRRPVRSCACMGLPGQVVEAAELARQTMIVDIRGQHQQVSAGMLIEDGMNPPQPGDWVLVHMGFALSWMDEAEALSTLASLDELSGMYAEFELSAASADSDEAVHSFR